MTSPHREAEERLAKVKDRAVKKFRRDTKAFLRKLIKEVEAGDYKAITVEPMIELYEFSRDLSHMVGLRIVLTRRIANVLAKGDPHDR